MGQVESTEVRVQCHLKIGHVHQNIFFLTLKEKCAGTPKTWSLLPKQISYVAHLKLNPSLGMQRYKDMTRYDKICRGLSLFVSRWLAFRRFQQHLLWRQRQQEIDDVGIGPVRVKPGKRQRKWGDHRCAMPSWPTLTQEMALMHGCS